MTKLFEKIYKTKTKNQASLVGYALFAAILSLVTSEYALAASVVQRGASNTTARPTVSRTNNATSRMPTLISQSQNQTETEENTEEETAEEVVETEPEIIVENKSSQFSSILDSAISSGSSDSSNTELADLIRKQREALDAQDATNTANATLQKALSAGQNACDTALRTCMREKCDNDFSKCSGDTDMTWGDKMDSCRLKTECTGTEYNLFAAEIKADRDMNARLASYNSIIDCGNRYNNCIITQCGLTFDKCLGKSAGDEAIKTCEKIAKECTQQDSGLASRAMEVFGTLRQDAEIQIKKDEERLYELRDLMRSQCAALGALFDERSLDCVYTVNFFAANSNTPYASKKAYAGSSFDCDQYWFGVDVTTFKENAYRLTRSETSATNAFMGAGIGTAVGAVTSGAISRAIDRQKAENALKDAQDEHKENLSSESSTASTSSEKGSNKNETDSVMSGDAKDELDSKEAAQKKQQETLQKDAHEQAKDSAQKNLDANVKKNLPKVDTSKLTLAPREKKDSGSSSDKK